MVLTSVHLHHVLQVKVKNHPDRAPGGEGLGAREVLRIMLDQVR